MRVKATRTESLTPERSLREKSRVKGPRDPKPETRKPWESELQSLSNKPLILKVWSPKSLTLKVRSPESLTLKVQSPESLTLKVTVL